MPLEDTIELLKQAGFTVQGGVLRQEGPHTLEIAEE